MNDKTILIISKVLGVIFAIVGVVFAFSSIVSIGSIGAMTVGNSMLAKAGESGVAVPYSAGFGGFINGLLGAVVTLCCAYGLLKTKTWAYKSLIAFICLNLFDSLFFLHTVGLLAFVQIVLYSSFAYVMYKHKNLFAN